MKLTARLVGAAALTSMFVGTPGYAAAQDTPAPTPEAPAAAPAPEVKEEMVCRTLTVTGSRLPTRKRICAPRAAWDEVSDEGSALTQKMTNSYRSTMKERPGHPSCVFPC